MRKDKLNVHVFPNINWYTPKSDPRFFFLTLTVRGHFHSKYFKWKKNRGTGLASGKMEGFYAELRKRPEPATSSYSATDGFSAIFFFCAWSWELSEDLIKLFSSWILLYRYFLTILIMVTEQLYRRKILRGCFRFIWLLLFASIMKRCAEWCALQLCHTSLINS